MAISDRAAWRQKRRLLLVQEDDEKESFSRGPGKPIITFIIGSDEAVDNVYKRLKALNDNCVIAGPYFDRFNRYTVEAVDPSGNAIAFCD